MAVFSVVKYSGLNSDVRLDAEHYQPQFLKQAAALESLPHTRVIDIGKVFDGNHLTIAEHFADEGIRYLRGQDLSDFFISDADPLYIPEENYDALVRSHMHPGDVLVSIVGTIGSVGLVTARHGKLTGSCKLAIIRPRDLPGEYVAAFLASPAGQNEIKRRVRGAVQMGLILPDLREIPIPIPDTRRLKQIVERVKEAQSARANAVKHYIEAEKLLLSSLRLESLEAPPKLCSVATLSKTSEFSRFDAEFFCWPELSSLWKSPFPLKPLGDPSLTVWLSNGATPAAADYMNEGVPIVKVGGVTKRGTVDWLGDRVRVDAPAASGPRGESQVGDVLMLCAAHHIRYIGKSGVLRSIPDGPKCRSVGELITVRAAGAVKPEVFCTYFNLPIIQTQIQRFVRGQSAHLYPSDLQQLPVPILPDAIQTQIVRLHEKSDAAQCEASLLLEEAKGEVAALILSAKQH